MRFMKPGNCMKKFRYKVSLERSGLSNADVAGSSRQPGEDDACSSHRSRPLFLKDGDLVVHPGSQSTDHAETSRTRTDLPAKRNSLQDVCVDTTVHEHVTPASFCTGLAQRQECCRCWIDALLQQWTHRSPSPQAQIGQVLDVWPCQTSSVTPTLAPCRLISTGSLSPDLFLLPFVLRLSPRASPFAH